MEMFTGTSDREDKVFSFLVTPEENLRDQIAARFSRQLGVLSTDNLAGEPVYVSVSNSAPLPVPTEEGKKRKATAFSTTSPEREMSLSATTARKFSKENCRLPSSDIQKHW